MERGLTDDRGHRQGDQCAGDAVQMAAQQQREDHHERVDPQAVAEHLRCHHVALELLQYDEQQHQPQRGQRLALEQCHQYGGSRTQHGPEIGDQLHQRVEHAEEHRIGLAGWEDPERPEQPQRDPGGQTHDEAEGELAAQQPDTACCTQHG
jgi:hypothetical protein